MSEFYGEPDIVVSNSVNHISEGMKVPNVVFKTRTRVESDDENPFVWKDTTTDDYFKGKKVILCDKNKLNAAIKIQKAFKLCRYNPNYEMCHKIQTKYHQDIINERI